jgi:hypothetical protein
MLASPGVHGDTLVEPPWDRSPTRGFVHGEVHELVTEDLPEIVPLVGVARRERE